MSSELACVPLDAPVFDCKWMPTLHCVPQPSGFIQVPPPPPLFSFWKSVSHWLGGWQAGWLAGCSMSPRHQPISAFPVLGFQVRITTPGFYKHQFQGLISGPQSCRESTWLTDPSPQPSDVTWIFQFRSDTWLALAGQAFYYHISTTWHFF